MKFKIKKSDLLIGKSIAILNLDSAKELHIREGERVLISKNSRKDIAVVNISSKLVKKSEVIVSNKIFKFLKLKKNSFVEISMAKDPKSKLYIQEKLNCKRLDSKKIDLIIKDIVSGSLTDVEIAYFISAVYKCGMDLKETEYLIKSMVSSGKKLNFKGKVADKHCIGGVAGNRTTPIIVSICSSTGLIIPKTSSRAITSAAGTADVIESISKIDFSIKQLKKIIKKTNACLVWNGVLGLSPADDKLIKIERILHIDPESQLLASVLSKKIAVGSKFILIDIPYGSSAKVSKSQAINLKYKFEKLSNSFNLKLKCILTDGSEPIGNGVGPLLEIIDILRVLENKDPPKDLKQKSILLSGELLELSGICKKNQGIKLAKEILESGKAFEQFKKIIKSQKGKIPQEFSLGKFQKTIFSKKKCKIKSIDNKKINFIASLAGAPEDKGAGLYLFKHRNQKLESSEPIIKFYSESKNKLNQALNFFEKNNPFIFYN